MTRSSQAGKRRGKLRSTHGSPVAMKGLRSTRGALGPNRKRVATLEADAQRFPKHQSTLAPRAEPSTNGAKQWTGGRRQVRKHR